mmetsp:Transcript_22606/g.38738  ORF Transcript_22606/g.38738 Transcript_22606/m.38738 type:complete len:82 (-) Transcript_22606:466-711(-)
MPNGAQSQPTQKITDAKAYHSNGCRKGEHNEKEEEKMKCTILSWETFDFWDGIQSPWHKCDICEKERVHNNNNLSNDMPSL